jgi:signal transduction histidine kinase
VEHQRHIKSPDIGDLSRRYGIALLSVGVASIITRYLVSLGHSLISPPFFAAVFFSAWYGGIGPGLLATALSGIITAFFLLNLAPARSFEIDLLRVVVFTLIAFLTSSLHAATRRARENAEAASAIKTRFLAMVSHELRTPLSPVLMMTEAMEVDPRLPPDVRARAATIHRHVQMEIRLIDDLVDIARISSGKMSLLAAPLDLHHPLESAIEILSNELKEKRMELNLQLNAAPSMCCGDLVRLQQVFWNLIHNAVKFTPAGGRISISTRNAGANITVEITDTGIGIDPADVSRIFAAFEQGETAPRNPCAGLGLGLAICQALVEAHGGTCSATSEGKGRGATFTITLPLLADAAATQDRR